MGKSGAAKRAGVGAAKASTKKNPTVVPSQPEPAAIWVPIGKLCPWAQNPRKNEAAVEKVVDSIKRFGFASPILARSSNGEIIAGHTRYQAAKALGLERVPVRYMDLDPADAHLLALADNKLGEVAEWDDTGLAALLKELNPGDLAATGWGEEDLERILGEAEALRLAEAQEDEDAVGAPPKEAESKPGEVYQLGPHRLLCGDSTTAEAWDQLLGGEKADMIWTDPPYGVDLSGKNARLAKWDKSRDTRQDDIIHDDDLPAEQLYVFLNDALSLALAHSRAGAAWYVAAPQGPLFQVFGTVLQQLGTWRQTLVWVKSHFALGMSDYHWRHEPIFYGWKEGAAHYFVDDRTQDTVWEFSKPQKSPDHPTMKPAELVQRSIRNSSKHGWLVVDPFGGSGTTLIAAAKEGRRAGLIEKDPGYCDVIRRRWEKFQETAHAGG